MVLIFDTMIAYGVLITTKILDWQLNQNGKENTYKSVCMACNAIFLHWLIECVLIWHNTCLWCVADNEDFWSLIWR